ncbi:oligosaccharide flippase family protein [Vibrio campbellii]|uniref:oligosaccharide flippase family protein n=1 Tax=Vibrio campbellii TaxID=680 RepID=UPI0038CD9E14
MRSLILKNSLALISLKLINAILVLGIVVLSAKYLGPEEYGKYALVLSIITLLSIPLKNGASNLTIREYKKGPSPEIRKKIDSIQVFYFFIFVISTGVLFSILYYLKVVEGDPFIVIVSSVLFSIGAGYVSIFRTYNIINERYRLSQIPEMLLSPVFILVFLFIANIDTGYFLLLINALSFLLISLGIYFIRRPITIKWCVGLKMAIKSRGFITSSLYMSALTGLQLINSQVDIYSLAMLSTESSVGIYKVANQFASFLFIPVVSLSIFVAPKILGEIEKGNKNISKKLFLQSCLIGFILSLSLLIGVLTFYQEAIMYLLGEAYSGIGDVLVILCVGAVMYSIFGPVLGVANMLGLEKLSLVLSVFSIAINITLNGILVPQHGAVGASVSTVISMMIWKITLSVLIIIKWRKV